ncbi:hypothetical protein MTR67_003375 [Solanum verrucosum]|uniref:RNase H type-1 domain-containing protein n=1 Tax=Solanum verrucosum TaxID=315347 RepID=A0AAF0PVG9_SOLVR|nr:hypothetical protein MTR67_003375 [Solanum verrucosum]
MEASHIWSFPPVGSIKMNTYGSYLHETGKASIGGIVRDSQGDLIMAFSISVNCNNHNMGESLAAEFGVKWYYQHGYTDFILELDSMIKAKMLINNSGTNLKLNKLLILLTSSSWNSKGTVFFCKPSGDSLVIASPLAFVLY